MSKLDSMNTKEIVDFHVHNNSRFANPKKLATDYKSRLDSILPKEYWDELSATKKRAVFESDQLIAKVAWCLETIGEIQDEYVKSFINFSNGQFYIGWCILEICDDLIGCLDKHFHEKNNEFGIEHIRIHTTNLQSLFPYKTFGSPGMTMVFRCSVCKKLITPRNHCGHEIGEIYNGEICQKIAENIELLEMSVVDNPAQKSSIFMPEDGDDYNYEAIKYIVKKVSSPWNAWDYEKLKKIIPKYKNIGRNEICPCGSGMKYKKCCLRKKQEINHIEFIF